MKLLTIRDIAKMLNISVSSVYHLIQAREINFYKIGYSVRIQDEDFNKYLQGRKINPIS